MAEQDTTEPIIQYAREKLLAYGIGEDAVITTVGNAKCYLQSVTLGSEGDSKKYRDNTGKKCALVISEQYQTLSCEGLLIKERGSGENPKKGDEVSNIPVVDGMHSGAGVHWRVESFSTSWSNEDVAKVSMTVEEYSF